MGKISKINIETVSANDKKISTQKIELSNTKDVLEKKISTPIKAPTPKIANKPLEKLKPEKTDYDKKNDNQIIKFSGNGCFVEFLKGGFELCQSNCVGKLHMNFVTFDKNNKQTDLISAYIDVDKWLAWQHEFESGQMIEDIHLARKKQLEGNFPYCKEVRISMGGAMIDGKMYSRQIKLTPGNKKYTASNTSEKSLIGQLFPEELQPIILSVEIFNAVKNQTGLFVPTGRAIKGIRIPIEREGVEKMFKMISVQINAHYAKEAMNEIIEKYESKIETINTKLDALTDLIKQWTNTGEIIE